MFKFIEYTSRITALKYKAEVALNRADVGIHIRENQADKIRLVFAGQYNVGKSSIIKMLTGRDDIVIDSQIATAKTYFYDWNGVEIIDTPGIGTQLRPDHDEISYAAIADADMLIFVISNELFDAYIASDFRKLAIDRDKAGEMILVVNQMDRTAGGNTAEQQAIIVEDLKRVISPFTPEQLYLSFLDVRSYERSVKERPDDPEYADDLLEDSGYARFVDTLNHFVKEKELPSKLTTTLYVIDDCLDKAIEELQPKSSDTDINALEEELLQHRHLLLETRRQTREEVKDIYTNTAAKIREYGLEAANLLVEGCIKEEVEQELQKYIRYAEYEIEKCQEDAEIVIDARIKEMGHQFDIIENSEFSRTLRSRLSGKFEGLPEGIKRVIANASPGLQKVGHLVLSKAYKEGIDGGLKLSNFSGSTVHDLVLKAGHTLHFKFKPWQAIKITRGIAVGSQVLNVLGVVFSVSMQVKADQDENKIRDDLRNNRQNVRGQFNTAANELENFSRLYIKERVDKPLEITIADIDSDIQEIRDTRAERSASCRELENLQKECRYLIQDIHNEKA